MRSKGFIVGIVVLVAVIFGGCASYSYVSGTKTTGVQKETSLNSQYLDNQNYLSAFISGFHEQIGVAELKSDRIDQILTDAVKGRYEDSGGFSANGAFFSAIVEAYPDLNQNMSLYDKVVDYVQAQREGYRQMQSKLLDMLRSYDSWRQEGLVRPMLIAGMLGIPSSALEARIGDTVVTGKDARNQMYRIVLASQAREAYETGTLEPLQVPSRN